MRRARLVLVGALGVLVGLDAGRAEAQVSYKGSTVRITVGAAAGGGFDTYARLVARHLGKHLPGNPTVIVENVTGAGGLVAANQLYKVVKPDGLTMGHFVGSLLLGQALGQPGIEFDARKFHFVGAANREDVVCGLTRASGITSLDKWASAKTPVKIGGVAPGAPPDNTARVLKAALGLPIQLVSGYKGTAPIRLAAEGGEVAGSCWSWESMRATWRKALESGDAVAVLQVTPKALPDLPRVPLAISLARTDEARRLIEAIHGTSAYARPFVLPPGVPRERVQAMRKAFHDALEDKALRAEAEKSKLMLEPVSGDELRRLVGELFGMDATLLARLRQILYN